jgi:hypothetical protein
MDNLLDEVVLTDQIGLDVFGIGELRVMVRLRRFTTVVTSRLRSLL